MRKGTGLLIAAVALLVGSAGAGVVLHDATRRPPLEVEDARVSGELWVVPGARVSAFLEQHGAPPAQGSFDSTPWVVGRVSWAARPGAQEDEQFTIMLGDENGGAGEVREVLGRPDGEVGLGNGSMWLVTVERTSWLRGSRPVELESGRSTDYGTFASLPTRASGDVWFVGQVLDTPDASSPRHVRTDARPVFGVAFSTGTRVWWVTKVASAP